MIRKITSAVLGLAALVGLAACVHAQGVPAQWRYDMQSGIATATYPGNVAMPAAAVTTGSVTATGAISGATITASGASNAASYTATGTVTGSTIVSTNNVTAVAKTFSGNINPSNVTSNWIETLRPASAQISQGVFVNSGGYIGLIGASQSSANTCTGCMGSIGLEAIHWNDNTTNVQYGYAGYFEATRQSGAGWTAGLEIDLRNRGTTVGLSPTAMFAANATTTLWLAAGAGEVSNPVSAAIGIIKNGATFDKGIVFASDALTVRADTKYGAINLGVKQAVSFFNGSGGIVGNIYNLQSGGDGSLINLRFDPNGADGGGQVAFENQNGTALFSIGQGGPILQSYTVANLPNCGSTTRTGIMAYATDLTAITYNGAPTGGGALKAPVFCNGTSWTIH